MSAKTIKYSDFFTPKAQIMQKAVDYYEGDQMDYVIQMLDGKMSGWGKRKDWKPRGIIPRVRNVTRTIIDKSGLLFNKPPQLFICTDPDSPPVIDPVFNEIMEDADWMEVMQNIDIYTRLCGSIIVLQQLIVPDNRTTTNGQYRYDYTAGDQLIFTILHHGNCVVKMNAARTSIIELGFLIGDSSFNLESEWAGRPKIWSYCVWTPDEIFTVDVNESLATTTGTVATPNDVETIVDTQQNPTGIITASFFYDTKKPRKGFWVRPPEDLVSLQEIVNLSYTDSEFAMAFQKQKTLFITGDITTDDQNSGDLLIPAAGLGRTPGGASYNDIPFYQNRRQSFIGGLGSIVKLGLDGGMTAGKAEFVGPDTDLDKLEAIVSGWVESVANDWCVNINYGGGGKANSGFQLIVEEISNLQLRQMRAQTMGAGLRRFYEIVKVIFPGQLTDGYLDVIFAPPNLPVNQMEQEQIWSVRIDNNRASIKDYLMEEKGMTDDAEDLKMAEILEENAKMNVAQPVRRKCL